MKPALAVIAKPAVASVATVFIAAWNMLASGEFNMALAGVAAILSIVFWLIKIFKALRGDD